MSPRHVPASVTELQRIGLFGSLPGETIAKLAERMVREEFPGGRRIVTEGDRTDRFYVLLSGLAGVTQEALGARGILRPGETFGEVAALLGRRPHGDRHGDDHVRRRELRSGDVQRAAYGRSTQTTNRVRSAIRRAR